MKRILSFFKNSILVIWNRHHLLIPPKYWSRYFKSFFKKIKCNKEYLNPFSIKEYNSWIENNQTLICNKKFNYNPLISFIIPVFNIEPDYLSDCLDSILNQSYKNFEVCLADDCSTKKETIQTLKKYEKMDKRIKVVYRKTNGHISEATNSALKIAVGEYIALMDDDDLITKDALYKIIEVINNDNEIDFIYSDEDKLDMNGNYCEPHFKPDFSKDSFFGGNYICHFTVLKKTILDKIGGFNKEFVGAQDFDLFLRATEISNKIYHIPEILYHWRKVPGSTADTVENKEYAIENGKKAVEAALKRRNLNAYVTVPIKCTHYVVHFNCPKDKKISIIMLDNTKSSILYNLNQIYKKNKYLNVEVIINYDKNLNLHDYENKKINFISNKNINYLIDNCNGDVIMIISGKIRFGTSDCIEELLGYVIQNEIGVVAPKIYYFSKYVKSAGLILSKENIYIDAFCNYFSDSTGIYGRLLVPYNYSALSNVCFMFEKSKYNKVKGFYENSNFNISNIDFCLKLISKGYRNVLLSHIYVNQSDNRAIKNFQIKEKDKEFLRKKWNLDKDICYNKNLNKTYGFMLNIGDKNEK